MMVISDVVVGLGAFIEPTWGARTVVSPHVNTK
jgi:hypothetical protein